MSAENQPKLSMDLTTGGFEQFLKDGGGIDFRLDEACWKPLEDGDIFEYVEAPDQRRRYLVKVLKKYMAKSFSDLIDSFPEDIFDKTKKQSYLDFFAQWWSTEEETRDGVLGLHIQVIPDSIKTSS